MIAILTGSDTTEKSKTDLEEAQRVLTQYGIEFETRIDADITPELLLGEQPLTFRGTESIKACAECIQQRWLERLPFEPEERPIPDSPFVKEIQELRRQIFDLQAKATALQSECPHHWAKGKNSTLVCEMCALEKKFELNHICPVCERPLGHSQVPTGRYSLTVYSACSTCGFTGNETYEDR